MKDCSCKLKNLEEIVWFIKLEVRLGIDMEIDVGSWAPFYKWLVSSSGSDVLIANFNKADFANVHYFSNFWPIFEVGGVAFRAAFIYQIIERISLSQKQGIFDRI